MKQKAKVKYSQNKTALFFLWPWILGLIIFTIGPMLISLYYSFTEYNLLSAPRWIGLENYKTMFFGDAWVLLIIIGVITLLIFRSSRLWVHYSDGGI